MLGTLLIAALSQASAVPPPMMQEGADCMRPVYATDQLVCSDPALAKRDRRMVELLEKLPADRRQGRWIENQWAWFRRSRLCAFQAAQAACVAAAYDERIAVLSALLAPTPPSTGPCVTFPSAAPGGRVVITLAADKVVAVGVAASPSWRPFVSQVVTRRGYVLCDVGGKVIVRCSAG